MKRFLNILLLIAVALSVASCEVDIVADVERPNEEFVIDYGTVRVVSYDDNCLTIFITETEEQSVQLFLGLRVEIAGRLVGEQD